MPETLTGDALLRTIKANFKAVCDVESEQRKNEDEDLKFQIPDNQWDELAKKYRKGRPMLSVSLLSQPMALIQNQAASAHLAVEVHPVSEKANPETADVMRDLYRRIERDSNAQLARLWALDRAKQCGRGWYRVSTQWDEDGDDPWDQEIVIERILYQSSVYMDPAAQKPDFSDANWCVVTTWVPLEDFRREFGDAQTLSDNEFASWRESDPKWVRGGGEDRAVLVAEYWWKEKSSEELVRPGDNLTRQKETTKVRWALATARKVLKNEPWMGRYIPIIPVVGTELQPFSDGSRRWEGMVRGARDSQKFANFAISSAVERIAMEPKSPFVGAEGFTKGHEDEWEKANVENRPFLEYSPTTYKGELTPPPQRTQIDMTGTSLAMMAFDKARELVQMTTAVYSPSLGEMPKERTAQSGRALMALQQQSDAGTSHYLQKLANVSMNCEARVVMDLMPKVYDRPGRIVQVLGVEDEPRYAMLNAPHTMGPDGRPQPIPQGGPVPEGAKAYDLSRGKYTVSVSVGKSFQTRLQQGAEELGQLIQGLPPQLQVLVLPTYMKFRDTPGAKELYDLLKVFRDKNFPGLDANKDGQPSPEQLQAKMQAMEQQGQLMQAQLQAAVQALQTKQVEQQAALEKTRMQAEAQLEKTQLDNDARVKVAEINAGATLAAKGLEAKMDSILHLLQLAHDSEDARIAQEHEDRMAEQQREHERGQAAFDAAKGGAEQDREDMRTGAQMEHQARMGREQMEGKAGMAREQMARQAEQAREQRAHESAESAAGRMHEATMAKQQPKGGKTE